MTMTKRRIVQNGLGAYLVQAWMFGWTGNWCEEWVTLPGEYDTLDEAMDKLRALEAHDIACAKAKELTVVYEETPPPPPDAILNEKGELVRDRPKRWWRR